MNLLHINIVIIKKSYFFIINNIEYLIISWIFKLFYLKRGFVGLKGSLLVGERRGILRKEFFEGRRLLVAGEFGGRGF